MIRDLNDVLIGVVVGAVLCSFFGLSVGLIAGDVNGPSYMWRVPVELWFIGPIIVVLIAIIAGLCLPEDDPQEEDFRHSNGE